MMDAIQMIEVPTDRGPRWVPAVVYGGLAVHPDVWDTEGQPPGYSVTHLASGMVLSVTTSGPKAVGLDLERATDLVWQLLRLDCDWELPAAEFARSLTRAETARLRGLVAWALNLEIEAPAEVLEVP